MKYVIIGLVLLTWLAMRAQALSPGLQATSGLGATPSTLQPAIDVQPATGL